MTENPQPKLTSFNDETSFEDRQKKARALLKESEGKLPSDSGENITPRLDDTIDGTSASKQKPDKSNRRNLILGSSAGLSVVAILGLAVVATILLSPSMLLLNIKEKLSNDMNDALGFYYTTTEKVMGYQISNGQGCSSHGDDSIQCKFSTMSENLRDRYVGYGFDVTESDVVSLGQDELNDGRVKVSGIKFPGGQTASSGNLYQQANRSELNRQRIDRVFNPSKGIFHSRGYIERLYERFHLQQSQIPTGLTNEDVIDSFNRNLVRQADYIDKDGRGVFGLHYLGETSDEYWYDQVYDNVLDKAKTHLALGCSMYTYADLGENALRQAKATTLARFAMQYLALADSIKAGRTMQLEQVIGSLAGNLTQVYSDSGESGFSASDMSSYRSPAFHEEPDNGGARMMNGRDYMLDYSNILRAVQGIGLDRSTFLRSLILIPATDASSGFLNNYVRDFVTDEANVTDAIEGVDLDTTGFLDNLTSASPEDLIGDALGDYSHELCAKGTTQAQADYEMDNPERCWFETSLPTAFGFGVAASAAVAGTYALAYFVTKPDTPPCLGLNQHIDLIKFAARLTNEPVRGVGGSYVDRVRSAARSEASRYEMNDDLTSGIHSTQTMDALSAGTGVILGDVSQWLGMQPATRNSLKNYLKRTADIRMMLAKQNFEEARDSPLDLTNPHSLIGSTLTSIYKNGEYNTIASLMSKTLSIVPSALSSALGRSVSATTGGSVAYLNDRLVQNASSCGIENTQSQINPDFNCAIRYSVNQATMNLSVGEVLDYMTSDDARDEASRNNSSEIQGRNIDQMGSDGERMKSEDSDSGTISFIDKKSGKPNPNTEYWKFIEYCSNRSTAWGSVGMAVAHKDEVYEPDARDMTGKRTYGPSYYLDYPTSIDNSRESYYGHAWGGSEDRKWLTGEKCRENSEMLNNFRAYTAMCAVHAATSGARKCWHHDSVSLSRDDFATTNGIMYVSE